MTTTVRRRTGVIIAGLVAGLVVAACSSSPNAATKPIQTVSSKAAAPESSAAPSTSSVVLTSTVAPTTSSTAAQEPDRPKCSQADDGPIVVWHSLGGDATLKAFDRLITRFDATHSSKVEVIKVGGYEDLLKRLASTAVDRWPDIVIGPSDGSVNLLRSGHFLNPADCADTSALLADLVPVVGQTYTVAGNLVAVPYGVSAPVLMFDGAEFKRAGLDPARPPSTLAELLDASRRLTASRASPHGLVLYDHFGEWVLQQFAAKRGTLVGTPANGRALEHVTVDFDTPENAADIASLRQGVREGHILWIGGLKADIDDLVAIVDPANGGSMTVHSSGALGEVLSLLAAGNFPTVELGVAPMPGPGPGSLAGGNALWLVDHGGPARAARAWTLIDWLSAPAQVAEFDAASGYVPAGRAAAGERVLLDRWAQVPQLRVAYDELLATPTSAATAGLLLGPSVDRDYILYSASRRLIDTDDPIDVVLRDTSALVNTLLATSG